MSKYVINPEAPLYPLSIENGGTNATTSAAAITNLGAMPEHPTHIEFVTSAANNGGYIDFNYPGSSSDFTSRIIEEESGKLTFKNTTINTPALETSTIDFNQRGKASLVNREQYVYTYSGDHYANKETLPTFTFNYYDESSALRMNNFYIRSLEASEWVISHRGYIFYPQYISGNPVLMYLDASNHISFQDMAKEEGSTDYERRAVNINSGGTGATSLAEAKKNLRIGGKYLITAALSPVTIGTNGFYELNNVKMLNSSKTFGETYESAIKLTNFVTIHDWKTDTTTAAFFVNKTPRNSESDDYRIFIIGTPGSTVNELSIVLWRLDSMAAQNVAQFIAD